MAPQKQNFANEGADENGEGLVSGPGGRFDAAMPGDAEADIVLQAFRLGYLTVEAYSRLKSPINRKPKPPKPDADRRFGFTDPGDESKYYQIFRTAGQLHTQAQLLGLAPPPMPLGQELRELLAAGLAPEARLDLHGRLDEWGQEVELQLNLTNEEAARAFGYGGSFALTYWAGFGIASEQQPREYGEALSRYRIAHTIERLETLRGHLPLYWIESVSHSLRRWGIGTAVAKQERFSPSKSGLEKQMTIWRDTLFGRRPPERILNTRVRNRVQLLAYMTSGAIVLAALSIFWSLLWIMPALVERLDLSASFFAVLQPASQYIEGDLPIRIDSKLDAVVKAASALVATVSSVAVFLSGMIARASGWILRLHDRVDFFYRSRAIQKRTLVNPKLK